MDVARAVTLAEQLVRQHGLVGWRVVVTRAKSQAGICRYRRREIGLSGPITAVVDEAEVRDTILHEIAHAIVGPEEGHGPVWRAKALEIGSSGERCASGPGIQGAWVGTCPTGHSVHRHRRPTRVMSCSQCRSSFDASALLSWTFNGRPSPMHPNYVAELAAIRAGSVGRPGHLRVGQRVRITAPGPVLGAEGVVLKRGRTSYHVRLAQGTYRVLFAAVEPVRAERGRQPVRPGPTTPAPPSTPPAGQGRLW